MKKVVALLIGMTIFMVSTSYASGGLQTGTNAVNTFKDWLYGFLGVVAFIYLMYKGVEAWAEKIQWLDFLAAIGKVAAVGGVLALTQWAWNVFA